MHDKKGSRAEFETAVQKSPRAAVRSGDRQGRRQVSAAEQQIASPDEAPKKNDVTKFTYAFGQGVAPRPIAVRRVYDIIVGKAVRRRERVTCAG